MQQYYMPVRVISGRACVRDSSDILRPFGKRALILCGYRSADRNGAIADVSYALENARIESTVYRGVSPNPTVEQVREIADTSREQDCDFIIAIGGGSVIDAAKAAAVLTRNEITEEELFSKRAYDSVLPIIAIPTTAGTGSEVTQYSIITNTREETKSFVISDKIFPQIAFLDGAYMEDLPAAVTIHTAVDALSHAIEGYLAVRATACGRLLALESIRLIAPLLKKMTGPVGLSLEDRDQLLYASMLAGIVISQSGTTAVHAVGYSLTYFNHVDHGRANGLLMPGYLDFLQPARKDEITEILSAMGFSSLSEFRTLCSSLLKPERLTVEEIIKYSEIAIRAGNIQNTEPRPNIAVLQNMLQDACSSGEQKNEQ